MKKVSLYIFIFALLAFGMLTLFMSSSVIFDLFGIRAKEGNYVPFIVWANWICGFLYIFSAYFTFKEHSAARKLLLFSLGILIVAFIAFLIYIFDDGIYEKKTLFAMMFRIIVTIVFIALANYQLRKLKYNNTSVI